MILAELVGLLVSFASVFISQPPQISRQDSQGDSGSTSDENQENEAKWKDVIHREYEREDGGEIKQETSYCISVTYVSVGSESRMKRTFRQSVQRSIQVNAGIITAVIPLGLLEIALIYFDLKTTDLCFEWENHDNNTIPNSVMRWKMIGEDIEAIPLFMWFAVTLALLFGWKEFKTNYISTLYIGFAFGATVAFYKTFLFVFGVFRTKLFYRYPGNALFLVGIIYSTILVARKSHTVHPSTGYSNFHITLVISFGFVSGFAIAMVYRYFIVPYFNEIKSEIHKAIMAAVAPVVAFIPTAICKYLALRQSSKMIQPDRSFILSYFLRTATISGYRIMQAHFVFNSFKKKMLFIGLSLLHGLSNVFSKATERLRRKMWTLFIKCLGRTSCGRRLKLLPLNTPHHRRFKADIEVQNILSEYNTLILSQAYLVLYLITSFDISPWPVIKESLVRMAIGLGIDFFFNCISVFIQIHFNDVPMRRVWFKCWKRHVFANAMMLMLLVIYFSPVFLLVFLARGNKWSERHLIKNCTLSFEN